MQVFCSTGGLLFVTQPSPKESPAQPGEVTECARDTFNYLNLTWNELYEGDIITRVCISCNIHTLLQRRFYFLNHEVHT